MESIYNGDVKVQVGHPFGEKSGNYNVYDKDGEECGEEYGEECGKECRCCNDNRDNSCSNNNDNNNENSDVIWVCNKFGKDIIV